MKEDQTDIVNRLRIATGWNVETCNLYLKLVVSHDREATIAEIEQGKRLIGRAPDSKKPK